MLKRISGKIISLLIKERLKTFFQQIIYSLNSPAGARNHQSIFYNTSIFDRDYFMAMFGEANYPDGSKPEYDEVKELQKFFMNWFGEERHKALLTFPVITAAYITENGKAKDEEFNNFIAEEMAKGTFIFSIIIQIILRHFHLAVLMALRRYSLNLIMV